MAFQNSEYGDDSIKKAQNVSWITHIVVLEHVHQSRFTFLCLKNKIFVKLMLTIGIATKLAFKLPR